MEINNNRIVPPAGNGRDQGTPVDARDKDNTGQTRQPPAARAEQLSLTDSLRQLQDLETRIASLPVVDQKRVEAVREAIASEQFNIDAESIADKLISLEQALTDTR